MLGSWYSNPRKSFFTINVDIYTFVIGMNHTTTTLPRMVIVADHRGQEWLSWQIIVAKNGYRGRSWWSRMVIVVVFGQLHY